MSALPQISHLEEITSYSHTIAPYLHQLSLAHVLPLLRREVSPTEWYLSTNPLISGVTFALFIASVVLVASELNRNYSQIDRLWSLLPAIYIGHFALYARLSGLNTERLDTLLMFGCLWGARLTFNYWRKGGYNMGSEDYRWNTVKVNIPPIAFFALNVIFISFYQSFLLLSVAAPSYVILLSSFLPEAVLPHWAMPDLLFSRGLLLALIAETFADQQQWAFQTAKASYRATGVVPPKFEKEDLDRGFVVTGLWSFSRHPNFAAEQMVWVGVYLWSCWVGDVMWYWGAIGAANYCLLFQASTLLTEWITAGKYKEYKEYQMRVNKFLPGWRTLIGGDELKGNKEL
ncbi:DUF1295-domain-containing protein [Morchella conica CCBAS932]|uniref:DUF1295-domain-containing protein n=1 Tax=Morchella conica CCBAS932 TaxID=1392247 RepID=A0A3N4KXY8_9PEZI|nr:DUF1295-domain-containing protein [Morchella conica CCBAS932]